MYQTRNSSCSLRDSVFSRVSRTFFTICIVIDEAPSRNPPRCRLRRSALLNSRADPAAVLEEAVVLGGHDRPDQVRRDLLVRHEVRVVGPDHDRQRVGSRAAGGAPSFFGTSTLTTIDSLPAACRPARPPRAAPSRPCSRRCRPSPSAPARRDRRSRSSRRRRRAKLPCITNPCRCGTSAVGMLVSSFAHDTRGTVNASAICGTTSSLLAVRELEGARRQREAARQPRRDVADLRLPGVPAPAAARPGRRCPRASARARRSRSGRPPATRDAATARRPPARRRT